DGEGARIKNKPSTIMRYFLFERSTRLPDQILVNNVDKALIIYKPETAIADSVMLRTIRFRAIK
ncbi:hypothetical protein ABE44_04505, partial [Bacillus thuringiensis]|nr:hypothetical protein [Bacillus thuringiensis]